MARSQKQPTRKRSASNKKQSAKRTTSKSARYGRSDAPARPFSDGEVMLTPEEVALTLRITVRKLQREPSVKGELISMEFGRTRSYRESDVKAFLANHERPTLRVAARAKEIAEKKKGALARKRW